MYVSLCIETEINDYVYIYVFNVPCRKLLPQRSSPLSTPFRLRAHWDSVTGTVILTRLVRNGWSGRLVPISETSLFVDNLVCNVWLHGQVLSTISYLFDSPLQIVSMDVTYIYTLCPKRHFNASSYVYQLHWPKQWVWYLVLFREIGG